MKKYLLSALKLLSIIALMSFFVSMISSDIQIPVDANLLIQNGLKSVYFYDPNGEKSLSFMKMIITISIYLLIDIENIILSSNINQGFKEIIRYHSKNIFEFINHQIKISSRQLIKNILFWAIIIYLTLIYYMGFTKLLSINWFILVSFLIVNLVMNILIILVITNSLSSIILFVCKHIVISLTSGFEVYFIILFTIILLFYIGINYLLGETNENFS